MKNEEILNLVLTEEDGLRRSITIRGYFKLLLAQLMSESESFSGKRPFGDSGWEYELYVPLIKAGLVKGKLDDYGDVEEVDTAAADSLLVTLTKAL